MAVVEELICSNEQGAVSFGNHLLKEKAKKENFEHEGALYKVKTYHALTKLEKNDLFLYESVPGTSVRSLKETGAGLSFFVEGGEDARITVGLKEDTQYEVFVGQRSTGIMQTNLSGKLAMSVELADMGEVEVKAVEA